MCFDADDYEAGNMLQLVHRDGAVNGEVRAFPCIVGPATLAFIMAEHAYAAGILPRQSLLLCSNAALAAMGKDHSRWQTGLQRALCTAGQPADAVHWIYHLAGRQAVRTA